MADEARSSGAGMADRTAWRICRDNRWWSVFGKKRGRTKKAGPPVHDDLVQRDFTAAGPNRLWLADITEHATDEGKLYFCAIKDVFSKRIVGYSIDTRMKSHLAVTALNNAVARREDVAGCVLHTDRGSQYTSRAFADACRQAGVRQSMSAIGSSADNALAESFNATFKRETLQDRRTWASEREARLDAFRWLNRYNTRRRHSRLGHRSPIAYETASRTTSTTLTPAA
ncbi:IS3 family transposase [Streptomyces sp. NPDC056390]|uniref:IS3 family transposase n=1 Tax=Streptomyces sp. NPDC056390 TaxID=3345806 RepID=UPI0035E0A4C5